MSRIALDTSVLVAAVQSWHSEHDRAVLAVGRALEASAVVVPFHVLFETYSVLTRMPKPLRLSPANALSLLERTLRGRSEVASLDGGDAFGLLGSFRDRGIAGGAVYDALIVEAAARAGARTLLTLNRKHFDRLAPEGLEVVEP
ncbi:MAG TPA: PIN domain-containing protein [Thermoanaerobaculia bacterium]|nr:PIN domain-containing protein [Thermoanaerobaculia bacterium]